MECKKPDLNLKLFTLRVAVHIKENGKDGCLPFMNFKAKLMWIHDNDVPSEDATVLLAPATGKNFVEFCAGPSTTFPKGVAVQVVSADVPEAFGVTHPLGPIQEDREFVLQLECSKSVLSRLTRERPNKAL